MIDSDRVLHEYLTNDNDRVLHEYLTNIINFRLGDLDKQLVSYKKTFLLFTAISIHFSAYIQCIVCVSSVVYMSSVRVCAALRKKDCCRQHQMSFSRLYTNPERSYHIYIAYSRAQTIFTLIANYDSNIL